MKLPPRAPRAVAGFTLIELMVGMTLGLVLGLAMLLVFNNISRSTTEMAQMSDQVEGGRFSVSLMANDVQLAGFWGSYTPDFDNLSYTGTPADAPSSIPDPCLAYSGSNWNAAYVAGLIGIGVQALDAAPGTCSSLLADRKANTDVLVVRHAESCVTGTGNCDANVTGRLYFQESRCSTQMTSTPYVLGTTGHDTMTRRDCTTAVNEKRRFISNIYYVRTWSNTQGDGIPALVRAAFDLAGSTLSHSSTVALVEGVEFLKVELGIDSLSDSGGAVDYSAPIAWADAVTKTSPTNRGDGIPDGTYVRCTTAAPCTAAQLSNVVSVKLGVLMRNTQRSGNYTDGKTYTLGSSTLGPFNDGYKRHAYTTLARLPTVAGRRETP